jgi:hypothetical protein
MSRRSTPERTEAARREATRQRLLGTGMLPERVDAAMAAGRPRRPRESSRGTVAPTGTRPGSGLRRSDSAGGGSRLQINVQAPASGDAHVVKFSTTRTTAGVRRTRAGAGTVKKRRTARREDDGRRERGRQRTRRVF